MISLEDIRCPNCGNEESFEVIARWTRDRSDVLSASGMNYRSKEITGVICPDCGHRSTYQEAQEAWTANKEASAQSMLVPTERTIGNFLYEDYGHRDRWRKNYNAIVTLSAYKFMGASGLGGRKVASAVFNFGVKFDTGKWNLSGDNPVGHPCMVWEAKGGYVVASVEKTVYYGYRHGENDATVVPIGEIGGLSLPPQSVSLLTDLLYRCYALAQDKVSIDFMQAIRNISHSAEVKVSPIISKNTIIPMTDEHVERAEHMIKHGQVERDHRGILSGFQRQLRKGQHASLQVWPDFHVTIVYSGYGHPSKYFGWDGEFMGIPYRFEGDRAPSLPENIVEQLPKRQF